LSDTYFIQLETLLINHPSYYYYYYYYEIKGMKCVGYVAWLDIIRNAQKI